MNHLFLDGFQGYRTRFDDVRLIQEFLEEVPESLGLAPAMPPFLLPYYNGVNPEDCGISAFLFLIGGHLTLHTFSVREVAFLDLLSPQPFDSSTLQNAFLRTFPCRKVDIGVVQRGCRSLQGPAMKPGSDFGPHLFLDLNDYRGPTDMDGVFHLLDGLPGEIGMTPIIRPYILLHGGGRTNQVISGITMISESHLSLHVWPSRREAFFDLFSCSVFDEAQVLQRLLERMPAGEARHLTRPRGIGYKTLRSSVAMELKRTRKWLEAIGEKSVS